MSENELIAIDKFIKMVTEKNVSNEFLVQICELSGSFLNLKTISDYAKQNNLSYNGVLKRVTSNKIQKVNIFNTNFIIDNE